MVLKVTKILGLNGNDTIFGTAASEQIFGFCGDDKIYGGGGNDTIYGGTGFDTVYFSEACSNYQIDKIAGGLQITHIKGSRADGSDFVSSDVERIVFGGKIYDPNCSMPPPVAVAAPPTARADTNWVKEDTNLAATGNVLKSITHGGAPKGAFGDHADTDPDSPVLTVKNPGAITGSYGKLVLAANGTYTYTLYTQAEKPAAYALVQHLTAGDVPLVESFNYKISDGTHLASSTLKISVFGTNDGVKIGGLQIEGPDQTVFESHLSATRGLGETDGSSPNAAALSPSGSFTISAPDGIGNLSIGGTLIINHGVITNLNTAIVTPFGTLKITAINLSTGVVSYTYMLIDNTVAHGPGNNGHNSVIDTIALHLTDRDGSLADAVLTVKIVDDVPSIQVTESVQPALTADESDLAVNASASFAGLFTSAYGADGPGSIAYQLGINDGATGLIDTLTSEAVVLFLNGGVVEGRTSVGNLLVFKVTVDGAGNVSLDQVRALQHPDASNPDDSVGLASAHLVTLTATIIDGDGDQAAQTADIGGAFTFKDDAPTAGNACVVLVAPDDNSEHQDHSGGSGDNSAQFQSSSNDSSDGNDGSSGSIFYGTLTHSYGADQAGHIALCSVTLPADGGFTQTGSGDHIIVRQDGVEILKIDLTDPVTGAYTLTQLASIHDDSGHGNDGSNSSSSSEGVHKGGHDDGDDDAAHIAFTLSYSVTDGDGDVVKGSLTIKLDEPTDDHSAQAGQDQFCATPETSLVTMSDGGHAFTFEPTASSELPSDILVPGNAGSDVQVLPNENPDQIVLSTFTDVAVVLVLQNENHEGLY